MNINKFERLPTIAAVVLVVLVAAACAVRLRVDEDPTKPPASIAEGSDPLATELAACRSVTYEQKQVLSDCRKAWADNFRQFIRRKSPSASSDNIITQEHPSLSELPKNQERMLPGYPTVQQSGSDR